MRCQKAVTLTSMVETATCRPPLLRSAQNQFASSFQKARTRGANSTAKATVVFELDGDEQPLICPSRGYSERILVDHSHCMDLHSKSVIPCCRYSRGLENRTRYTACEELGLDLYPPFPSFAAL